MKLKSALKVNVDNIRIKEFTLAGQLFRVRIPLATEAEALYERSQNPPDEIIQANFEHIAKPLLDKKDELAKDEAFVFTEDDVIVKGKSIRGVAKTKAQTESRIVESFKLLIPAEGHSLDNLTYKEINDEFPLKVQLEIVRAISEAISPDYEETRKN